MPTRRNNSGEDVMEKEPSAYTALLKDPGTSLSSERILWLHVVCQLLIDASSRKQELRQETADWVESEDFEIVCGMASLHIEHMRHAFNAILDDKYHKRAFKRAMDFRFMVRAFVERHTGDIDKD
jgi:hypothetical protein